MTTLAILAVSACALIGWCALVQAVRDVLAARAQPPACPCRDLTSLTVSTPGETFQADIPADFAEALKGPIHLTAGNVFELPHGAVIQPASEPEADTDPFQEIRDARDILKAKRMLTSLDLGRRLEGEILMLKVNLRRKRRGLPALGFPHA